jgi:hypothetical protein
MHGEREHDREPASAIPTGRRVAAMIADLALALAFALVATAAALAAVISFAMNSGGAQLPPSPVEALAYLAFPVFEFLLFTPVVWVAPVTAGGLVALFWLCRRGVLPLRSPGMVFLGVDRLGTSR